MPDINNEETKPSDIVGTGKEFQRIENTLPVQHQSKGLQPIIPLDSGNRKTGRTIGSMGVRQEKSLTDIDSIGQSAIKEINNIVTPATHQEKSDQNVASKTEREYKQGEDFISPYNRSIKYQELEKDVQRLAAKRDANVDADVLHQKKKEDQVQSPMSNARKTEQQFKELSHFAKKEMNIFDSLDHKNKKEDEIDSENIRTNKQEIESDITSSNVKKQEIETNAQDPQIKKQEIDTSVQDPQIKKQEEGISSDHNRTEKQESPLEPKSLLSKNEIDLSIQDSSIEKSEKEVGEKSGLVSPKYFNEKLISSQGIRNEKDWEQTIGNENLPSLQKDEKLVQYNTTEIKKDSIRDFDPNRELKAGIDGITAESTVDAIITSNYSFVNSPEPGLISNAKKITTKKSTKQVHNISFDNVFSEFENALSLNIKESKEFGNNNFVQNNKKIEKNADISASSINQESSLMPQIEGDHTKTSISDFTRSRKTQDIINKVNVQPNNINNRANEDRSDLSKQSIDQESILISQTEVDHTKSSLPGNISLNRPAKKQDVDNVNAQPINNSTREDRYDFSIKSIDQKSTLTSQTEVDHTKSSLPGDISLNRDKKTRDATFIQPNNIDDRIKEDRSDLSKDALGDSNITIATNIDFSARSIGPIITAATDITPADRGLKLNKGSNDLFGDAKEPIVTTSLTNNSIAYRPERQDSLFERFRGINVGTLASFIRPIGNLRKLSNNFNSDIAMVALNASLPLLNGNEPISSFIKGSTTAIPLTLEALGKETNAGDKKNDLVNYSRHALINAFRMIANNVVDQQWIQGSSSASDKQQAINAIKNSSPEAGKIVEQNTKETKAIPSLTQSTSSQDVRGQINLDIGKLQGGYSNASINNSIASKYKDFESYRNMLKKQLAKQGGLLIGNTAFVSEEIDKSLITEYNKNPSNDLDRQRQKMIGQLISFEAKLNNKEYIASSYDKKNGIYSYENAFYKLNPIDYSQNTNLKNNTDPHIFSSLISTANNKDPKDLNIVHRSAKDVFRNKMETDFSKNTISFTPMMGVTPINLDILNQVDSENPSIKKISSLDIYSRSSTQKEKGKKIDYNYLEKNNLGNITDPHFTSSFISHTNRDKENRDYNVTDRNIRKNVYTKLASSDKYDTMFLSGMDWATPELKEKNTEIINSGLFSRITLEKNNILNNKSLSDLTREEITSVTTQITSAKEEYNREKYVNIIRSAKDVWAKYAEKYDINNDTYGEKDGRDRSTSILAWNIKKFTDSFGKKKNKQTHPISIVPKDKDKIIRISTNNNWVMDKNSFTITDVYGTEITTTQRHIKDDFFFINNTNTSWNELGLDTASSEKNKSLIRELKTVDYENKDVTYPSENPNKKIADGNSINGIDVNVNEYINKPYGHYRHIEKDISHTSDVANDPRLFKDVLEISDFTKRSVDSANKQDFLGTSNKTIFGGGIKRYDLKSGKDEWQKALDAKRKTGIGSLIVFPNPTTTSGANKWYSAEKGKLNPSETNVLYNIPFQFNPEITGESRQASWATHTGYGRTNEFYTWNSTSSRQVSFKTTYIATDALSTGESEYKKGSSAQYPKISFDRTDTLLKNEVLNTMSSGHGGWGPGYIHKIIEMYRSLVLPMNMSKPALAVPPVIMIDFNGLFKRYSKHSKVAYARWICEDVSIDPITELGYTVANFPFGFEITLTLKEVLNDWGDYQDIQSSFIDNHKNFDSAK